MSAIKVQRSTPNLRLPKMALTYGWPSWQGVSCLLRRLLNTAVEGALIDRYLTLSI